jgi:hypothetical protein
MKNNIPFIGTLLSNVSDFIKCFILIQKNLFSFSNLLNKGTIKDIQSSKSFVETSLIFSIILIFVYTSLFVNQEIIDYQHNQLELLRRLYGLAGLVHPDSTFGKVFYLIAILVGIFVFVGVSFLLIKAFNVKTIKFSQHLNLSMYFAGYIIVIYMSLSTILSHIATSLLIANGGDISQIYGFEIFRSLIGIILFVLLSISILTWYSDEYTTTKKRLFIPILLSYVIAVGASSFSSALNGYLGKNILELFGNVF